MKHSLQWLGRKLRKLFRRRDSKRPNIYPLF